MGARLPKSATSPPCGSNGLSRRAMIDAVDIGGGIVRKPLAQRLAGHRHAIEMEQRLELAQQRAHAAGGKKILHVAVADRLEVDQHRRRVRKLVELLQATPSRRRDRR